MIDKSTRKQLAERKERVRRRINTKVDPENYEFIPAKKPIDYYDNDIRQRVAVYARVSSRQLVFAVLLDRKVVRVAGFQLVEHDIHRVLEGLIVLSGFRGIDHFEQGSKVFLVIGCLIPDVADESCVVELFRLDPEIFAGLIAVSLRVDDDRIDQLEDVLLAADVAERVVVHGFSEIDGVQRLDDVASLFKHFAALHQHRSFRVLSIRNKKKVSCF